jgi:hypothetical protein
MNYLKDLLDFLKHCQVKGAHRTAYVQVIQYSADSIEEILFFSVGGSITHI